MKKTEIINSISFDRIKKNDPKLRLEHKKSKHGIQKNERFYKLIYK